MTCSSLLFNTGVTYFLQGGWLFCFFFHRSQSGQVIQAICNSHKLTNKKQGRHKIWSSMVFLSLCRQEKGASREKKTPLTGSMLLYTRYYCKSSVESRVPSMSLPLFQCLILLVEIFFLVEIVFWCWCTNLLV